MKTMIVIAVLALSGWTACGGAPEPRPAIDLGTEQVPTTIILTIQNTAPVNRAFMVRSAAFVEDVPPSDVLVPTSSDREVSAVLLPGSSIASGGSVRLEAAVYEHRIIRFDIASWDPTTGGERSTFAIDMAGRTPPQECHVYYDGGGLYRRACE